MTPETPNPAQHTQNTTVSGDHNIVGDHNVVTNISESTTYQLPPPPTLDAATLRAAHAQLAQLPLDSVPPISDLPIGSHMPFATNPLFVGRQPELKQLAATLKAGRSAAISQIAAATGLGGIGKSQLAIAFSHHYGNFFAGGVYWLSFADPGAISAQFAICGNLMPDLPGNFASLDLESQVRQVRSAFQSPLPRLLIFDNCEDPALLAQWRPTSGGSRLLLTSRRPNWDESLGVQTLPLETLTRAQSIELLRKFRPDLPAHDPTLDQIAAYLGDLPLALHLAGNYLKRYQHELTLPNYLHQLRQPDLLQHRSLQSSALSPTGHEQHVARTFALSYDRLTPDHPSSALALALLTRAACFAPGQLIPRPLLLATIETAEESDPLQTADALEQLANLGLLEVDDAGDLLLHRLVAHFVQQADPTAAQNAQQAVATALLAEADRLNNAGIPGPLLAWQSHLRHITDARADLTEEQSAGLCNEFGFHLNMLGNYAAARPYYERALAIREEVLGAKHPHTASSLNNLGALLDSIGDYAAARPYYERALAIREEVLGAKHPDTALSLNNLGALLQAMGEYAAARPYYERALAIREEVLGAKHPDTARSLNNLGMLLKAMGDNAAARPYCERALAIFEERLGPTHPYSQTVRNNLASLE